jgi:hypothetical protein
MHTLNTLLLALPLAAAYPSVMKEVQSKAHQRRVVYPTVPPPNFLTYRDNCGSHGNCTVFNAEDQLVRVDAASGHDWQAPGANDLRGQCPVSILPDYPSLERHPMT